MKEKELYELCSKAGLQANKDYINLSGGDLSCAPEYFFTTLIALQLKKENKKNTTNYSLTLENNIISTHNHAKKESRGRKPIEEYERENGRYDIVLYENIKNSALAKPIVLIEVKNNLFNKTKSKYEEDFKELIKNIGSLKSHRTDLKYGAFVFLAWKWVKTKDNIVLINFLKDLKAEAELMALNINKKITVELYPKTKEEKNLHIKFDKDDDNNHWAYCVGMITFKL